MASMPAPAYKDNALPKGIRCPNCNSDAFYRYGRTHAGKQRLLCLVCNRQFTLNPRYRAIHFERPVCPECGHPMHVYKREAKWIRFRCSKYPACRTFLKKEI